ncbi:MAG: hypothetical protein AAGB01_09605, partial [Cyanobacteria bacterium P01_F01_bin.42]
MTMKRFLYVLLGGLVLLLSCQGVKDLPRSAAPPASVEPAPQAAPSFEIPQPVSRDRLQNYLAAISGERYSDRQRQASRQYIESVLRQNGWQIEEQTFAEGVNIIAYQPSLRPNQRELLVGAHFDSVQGTPG